MKRFTAEVYEGHSDCAILVPFDPASEWGSKPYPIGYRKHLGHAVRGTIDGHPFEGWIWFYFKEWRMVIDDAVLRSADIAPGNKVKVIVRPHSNPETVAHYKPGGARSHRGNAVRTEGRGGKADSIGE